jgi:hypothetical protein
VVTLLALAMAAPAGTPADVLPSIDFRAVFPYLAWLSTEGHDDKYPDGFRDKLLSVRSADSQTVEFALIRELSDGTKTVALHARGPLSPFGETATALVNDFSRRYAIRFERIDLTDVRDLETFRARAAGLGWDVSP